MEKGKVWIRLLMAVRVRRASTAALTRANSLFRFQRHSNSEQDRRSHRRATHLVSNRRSWGAADKHKETKQAQARGARRLSTTQRAKARVFRLHQMHKRSNKCSGKFCESSRTTIAQVPVSAVQHVLLRPATSFVTPASTSTCKGGSRVKLGRSEAETPSCTTIKSAASSRTASEKTLRIDQRRAWASPKTSAKTAWADIHFLILESRS